MPTSINKIQKIKKRDGRIVPFDQRRITNAVHKAFVATREEDGKIAGKISDKIVKILNVEFKPSQIPTVEQIQDIVIKAISDGGYKDVTEAYLEYRKKRTEIREMKYFLLYRQIKNRITPNSLRVLESRYLRKDESGKVVETPTQLFRRVAENIAAAEKFYNPEITDDQIFQIEEKFYKMMALLEFLPNSPTLMNAGLQLQQLSACFVLDVPDSMNGIFDTLKHTALIHQTGGGTGFSFSKLRPKGDTVRSTQGVASGPISFMRVFDAATEVIKQGGKRRGANMGVLRIDHPDILEFVTAKQKEGILANFNISVAMTDDFMKHVIEGTDYDLVNPRTGALAGKKNAREMLDLIVRLAWETGDPGVLFIDKINKDNPTPKLGMIETTNPCGETPLLSFESCNLASLNLAKFIEGEGKKSKINFEHLGEVVRGAVHFLDNVIDMNRYPLPEIEALTKGNRKIGLGVMGWADILIKLEIPYDSEKAIALAKKIMKFISSESKNASAEVAKIRGVFPNFKDSIFDKPGNIRVRNATTNSIAPTGTIAIIAGCSSSIEPYFALAYRRMSYIGKTEEAVELIEVNPLFEEVAKREGFYSEELMKKVVEKGTVKGIEDVPEKWQKIFVTAHDIAPEWHIKTQAAFQQYTDLAVSKTINFPYRATVEDVEKSYLLAYKLNCKGITIFRSESRQLQVLSVGAAAKKEEEKAKPELGKLPIPPETPPEIARNPELKDPLPEFPEIPPGSCPTCTI